MQLLMRRPEIAGFISVAPPANMHDFSFLAPCPSSGIMISGTKDDVVPSDSVEKLVEKLRQQRGIRIDHSVVSGANHFFANKLEQLEKEVAVYIDERLRPPKQKDC